MRGSVRAPLTQVEQQLRERVVSDGAVDTQVFYTRFRAAALDHKPLMSLLHQRIDVHESYAATLEELEAFYVHLRVRLISTPVTAHLQAVLKRDLQMSELAPATRQASMQKGPGNQESWACSVAGGSEGGPKSTTEG